MASMQLGALSHPVTMNVHRQWMSMAPAIREFPPLEFASNEDVVRALSHLLYDARYTLLIAEKFRPILMILCALWLDNDTEQDNKLAALSQLVNPHEELFPILSTFLRESSFSKGVMADLSPSTPTPQLHLRLLAYYRILTACPHIPKSLDWSTELLSQLICLPHPDPGVRWLAVRCYALHMRITEAERDDIQLRVVGPTGEADMFIQCGKNVDGTVQYLDGWLLPVKEEMRIRESRQAMLTQQDFYEQGHYTRNNIELAHLTRRLVDMHGILLLKDPIQITSPVSLVPTASTIGTLRELAIRISLRLPTLLSSPPSSGKTLLLKHLASLLYPGVPNQVVTLHLSDTSLDARSLLGSYVSSVRYPGTFEWQEGIIIRAMKHGLWLVLEDIDRASSDILGSLNPLVESLAAHKHVGTPASLKVPGRGEVESKEGFMVFATRSVTPDGTGKFPPATFLGTNKFSCIDINTPSDEDLATIICSQCPRLGTRGSKAFIRAWVGAKALGPAPGARNIGIRELQAWCIRVENLLRSTTDADVDMVGDDESFLHQIYKNVALQEDMFLEARDVFFGAGAFSDSARVHMADVSRIFAEQLGLSSERAQWVLEQRVPRLQIEKDFYGRTLALQIGKTRLTALQNNSDLLAAPQRPFAMHRPALLLTERIATSLSFSEAVLLVGETGTGKTTIVSHIASLLNRKLISLNLSHQTESSDLVGGFKPVDTRVPGSELQRRFTDLFSRTFSRRKNSKFEDAVRKAAAEAKWKRAVGLWKESARLAMNKIRERSDQSNKLEHGDVLGDAREPPGHGSDSPRKRRKVEGELVNVQESEWLTFDADIQVFDIQHIQGKGKFALDFVEGPLVEALRKGHWVLLDEINLASPETLECISNVLQGPTSSIVLTEQGSFVPIPRHPDFRLFACMNPATDVGKKDLPPNIRSRFTEIHVPPPDADRETLLSIIQQYIGHCALADKRAILDTAEFYMEVKEFAERHELADGSNHRPHFSMRTLTRALTFTSDAVAMFGIRRALWEGCLMAFSMALDEKSTILVRNLAEKHLLSNVKNVRAMTTQIPVAPGNGKLDNFERVGPFWLERGNLTPDPASEYILTPSVQSKLVDLARVVLTRRFPVLLEGPTSSGKTSAVEYLARRTGHRFVRVNNHEHTDIQEYLGTYVSDPETGKLAFHDGILVRALRNGDWIVLDELNLAPTDVLEALNRLLDDNREIVIPETQEVVKPHPQFMLFGTQNPPGLYAGRKVLSRAFRNRFLEVHFNDVPQSELQTILSERSRIPDSHARKIISVFQELSKRRQAGRVFETKHGFATLRDLFRWAGREALSTKQLAYNGYMLLAERARRQDDKDVVQEVIETVMNERIDTDTIYDFQQLDMHFAEQLGVSVPSSSNIIWTSAMKRLFVLVANALRFNEPVLLVGPTGSGKTSVCQLFAEAASKQLVTLNCHQGTETADLIGGQRPLRNRKSSQSQLISQAKEILSLCDEVALAAEKAHDVEEVLILVKKSLKMSTLSPTLEMSLRTVEQALHHSTGLFEWHDGPLIRAMKSGDLFLLDEISLADDSVLERLNSVLEPARNIVLAERGGYDVEHAQVTSHPGFKLLATMNPGGDYGKKELSPALRNRFTEIWVPQVETRSDRRMIINKSWRHEALESYTDHVLNFSEWLATTVGEPSFASLRDLLTWVDFSNQALISYPHASSDMLFHHAAHLVFLDGLESSPHTSSWSNDALTGLRECGRARLEQMIPLGERRDQVFDGTFKTIGKTVLFGAFGVSQGPRKPVVDNFSLRAPTTLDNMRRLVRACQILRPILLEGSPGVGKTSLVAALADVSGHRLCRINLSDQTDLMDLFGSDLPVEGGRAGEFAWKDAAFLRAMQDGDWVLLDEMNLAPQAVLEGLNAVLDHRGTVFIPELGRSFAKHPAFRIFAAQNPLYQGGGRKGLPKSFLDRFTKVHVNALSSDDFLFICQNLFPALPLDHVQSMIHFNARLHDETMIKRSFGREGSPWEFNLRDIIRWATLMASPSSLTEMPHPSVYLDTVYLQRFRSEADRRHAIDIFRDVFSLPQLELSSPWVSTTSHHTQFGAALLDRGNYGGIVTSVELQRHLRPLASASECINRGWLIIISGPTGVGKTHLARYLAAAACRQLHEFSMSSGTDTSDLLGSFEQTIDSDSSATLFEWVDGPLVQAVKEGHWLVLDNANLCSPSVLDRLNSLCETNGVLVLTERGHLQGELVTLTPHPQFQLILTLDPRNGELSRAMRNRGVEIHLPMSLISPQDQLRLQSIIRTPLSLSASDSATRMSMDNVSIQFELLRRGISQMEQQDKISVLDVARGYLVSNDTVSSMALDQIAFQHVEAFGDSEFDTYAHAMFSLRSMPPSHRHVLRRTVFIPGRGSKASIVTLNILLDGLQQSSVWELRRTVETMISTTRGVPLSFISNQPFDISMNPNLLTKSTTGDDGDGILHEALSRAIELVVHVHFFDHRETSDLSLTDSVFNQSRLLETGKNATMNLTLGVASIFPLYSSAIEFTHNVIKTLHLRPPKDQLSLIGSMKDLVDITEHMRYCSSEAYFDFTSARVISRWLCDVLALNPTLRQSPVYLHATRLENEVSLTSGHGMQEIWRNFTLPELHRNQNSMFTRLDRLGLNLDARRPSYFDLRAETFNAMALLTLNTIPSTDDQGSVMALCNVIEQRLAAQVSTTATATYSHQVAISGLDFLSAALVAKDYDGDLRRGEFLIRLTSQTPHASLAHATQVQHYLWTLDDLGETHATHQPALLASLLQRWMSELNNLGSDGRTIEYSHGPGVLLRPLLLHNIITSCDHDRALDEFETHENSLHLDGQLAVNHCREDLNDRMRQIIQVWKGVLVLIMKCFGETYSVETMRAIEQVASKHDSPQTCRTLVDLLSRTTHPQLSRIAQDRLLPAAWRLDSAKTELDKIRCTGTAWIASALALLEIYVPNVPLDPVATQRCVMEFWRHREMEVLAQIQIHMAAEDMITGKDDTPILLMLRSRLDIIRSKLQSVADCSISRAPDIKSLHAFHGELTPFLNHIVGPTKLEAVVRDLEAGREDAESRAVMVQKSILGFIVRAETAYPQLTDIIQPISTALSQLVFGLDILLHGSRRCGANPQIVECFRTLVRFPSAAIMNSIGTYASNHPSSSTNLLFGVIATAYDMQMQASTTPCYDVMDRLYDRLTRLWLEDRDEEEKELQESQSLYRQKNLDIDAQEEGELEEREFRELFPAFDSDMESSQSASSRRKRVCDSDLNRVYRIHLWIFDSTRFGEVDGPYDEFNELRNQWIRAALDSHPSWFSQTVDSDSLPYQILLLSNAMKELKGQRPMKRGTYSFYHDSNIPEVRKAISVVRNVQGRLLRLLQEWPDQMVLHNIVGRCDAVLKLGLHSPVAKVLIALEQLLLQTEDWEIYSNRENTLKPEQAILSALIVEWRRLELSCWSQLLEAQSLAFSAGTAEWWFRLYELTIRGTLAAATEEPPSVDEYLTRLIPLVEQFISAAPLGQYRARIQLLGSFSHYAEKLSATKTGSESGALIRTSRILRSLNSFYDQFSNMLSRSLVEKRGALEKELSDFIRMASWKDVNVHALRQSAQRTHRQLYKCIRKFRELLREPVTPFLSYEGFNFTYPDDTSKLRSFSLETLLAVEIPKISSNEDPFYLLNLQRTYSKFKNLLTSHGQSALDAVSFGFIERLAGQIAETVATLSKETDAAGSDARLHKTLVMRKRKAWVDLLKELKRAGLQSRLKPEIIAQQQDKVWLMDRFTLISPKDVAFADIVTKGEEYFNRMLVFMPELRRSLGSHHEDIPTRELGRAITFVESSFSLALSSKSRFSADYLLYQEASRVALRLRQLAGSHGTIHIACDVVPCLELCCKLEEALKEVSGRCEDFSTLGNTTSLSPVVEAISAQLHVLRNSRLSLFKLYENVHLTHKGLMLSEEHSLLEETRANILSIKASLQSWISQEPCIRHLCCPVVDWLESIPDVRDVVVDDPRREFDDHDVHRNPINRLLVIVQGILNSKASRETSEDGETPVNFASESERICREVSRLLALESVSSVLSSFIEGLINLAPGKRLEKIQIVLPFVDAYLALAHDHLLVQAQLSKALLKLSYILCSVIYTLSTQGFCKPPEKEEESAGNGRDRREVQEGTGVGQGTGSENISNQIEDESQVEGLRGEETNPEKSGDDGRKEDGIEMVEDFEGEMEDMEHDEPEEGSDSGSQPEAEEHVGDIDPSDRNAVDEKLWGDDKVEDQITDGRTSKNSAKKKDGDPEMMAKEISEKNGQGVEDQKDEAEEPVDGSQKCEDDMPQDHPIDAGRKMDDFVPEGDTLDLPDDLNLPEEGDGEDGGSPDMQDDPMDEEGLPESDHGIDRFSPDHLGVPPSPSSKDNEPGEAEDLSPTAPQPDDNAEVEQPSEPTTSRPDISTGDDGTLDPTVQDMPAAVENFPTGVQESSQDKADTSEQEANNVVQNVSSGNDQSSTAGPAQAGNDVREQDPASVDAIGASKEPSKNLPNPLRSLGDTLKELQRRFDKIGDALNPEASSALQLDDTVPQVEYLQEGMDEEHNLQALGPAKEDQVAKLSELKLTDDKPVTSLPDDTDIEPGVKDESPIHRDAMPLDVESSAVSKFADVEDAISGRQVASDRLPSDHKEAEAVTLGAEMDDLEDEHRVGESVALAVKEWQETGHSDSRAAEMWRLYDSLTQELSYTLCEQLRLILEPTLATRLRGDYRTGKRLNMKKIIPYIASEYTKDKIWLRRTRPSLREYQVLIALDDSRSMSESRSVHLAYETLALVSKALNRLESGEVAIARFGESVEMVHGFDEGMVGDREGEKVMRRFKFEQRKTDMLGLVETSLKVFTQARERRSVGRSSAAAADLWQLEIIISDGICQDHDKLRTVLRKAEEQRVMIVFIIVDSLHVHEALSSNKTQTFTATQNTILSMNQVSYKDIGGGRMELQMERYLDSFPFPYYVVLRNVDALPDVLSGTLKQFFERISEA